MSEEQRTAAISGAAQGIGRSTAELLAERGYRVALNDLRMPEETLAAIRARGGEAMAQVGNVTDEAVAENFARAVSDAWGRADVLVNNAGISLIAAAEETTAADYRRVLEVNLVAPFLLARAFGSRMLAAGQGCIVNVASVAGLVGIADRAAYNASKHGLIGLTRTLAAEWGDRGVRVNAVCPGGIRTDAIEAYFRHAPGVREATLATHAMRRLGEPDEIAQAVAWLCSDRASFVTGHALIVDGGVLVNPHTL